STKRMHNGQERLCSVILVLCRVCICIPYTKGTFEEVLMLKGNLSPYLDPHNEEESSYVTLSNGPYVYVGDSTNTEPKNDHVFIDVYFLTPILCKHYIERRGPSPLARLRAEVMGNGVHRHVAMGNSGFPG
ncbi:hypothetical protein WN55_04415, partial [Dufourea novaeangliae]